MKKTSFLAGILLLLTGCSGAVIDDYAGTTPVMDVRQYFNGDVDAWGVYMNRSGKIERKFHVAMHGAWKDGEGSLNELFTYDDGTTQKRSWKLRFTGDNTFVGTAADIVGEAKGSQVGNAVNMKYIFRLPSGGTSYDLDMDDWLYQLTDDIVINRVFMKKFGFSVGELYITYRKR